MMGCSVYGTYDSFWSLLLNILVILIIVGLAFFLINRSYLVDSGNNERFARLEKDFEDIRRTVEDIKEKLDEI
ncbi:hypothetical protein HWN40_06575 [Methanolobus zinderi]|uniref:Uncharacterized protein n=1 Tax=Methanolobus zinderi TaxID=536044 RepID=A0A7D5EES1_9EURY|nr:hypothetical protein [Methanolobus zinderi]QLC49934.1 hypothetical protein HWN40_06575 [Methanolobus zinderi]